MNKTISKLLFSGVLFLIASVTHAAFILNNDNGGDGYVTGSYPSFDLFGADNGALKNTTTYTETFSSPTTLSFNWTYTTHDCCGSYWDPAGYIFNGIKTQLSTDSQSVTGGGIDSSGLTSIALSAGDTFGWYVYSVDSQLGRGDIAVTVVTVAEPAYTTLLVAGLLGFWPSRRKVIQA